MGQRKQLGSVLLFSILLLKTFAQIQVTNPNLANYIWWIISAGGA